LPPSPPGKGGQSLNKIDSEWDASLIIDSRTARLYRDNIFAGYVLMALEDSANLNFRRFRRRRQAFMLPPACFFRVMAVFPVA
jgi:hypothetical protein